MKAAAVYTIEETPEGYTVCRDGVTMMTPAGLALSVPSKVLAETIAGETPHPRSKPADIPFFQLAATAIDLVTPKMDETVDGLLQYAGSELLCYRAETPSKLIEEQNKVWQPLLDWCAQRFKAPLQNGIGIAPVEQPVESLQALRKAMADYNAFRLTGLREAASICGSLVLALALSERHLNADEACHAAELDTAYQMKEWGEDLDTQKRIDGIRRDLQVCEQWLELLQT